MDSNINFSEEEKIQRAILYFLYSERCFREGHFSAKALKHVIRVDKKPVLNKKIKKQVKTLINEGYIRPYSPKNSNKQH